MTKAERKSTYELVTERVIAAMESGQAPWQKPWVFGARRHSNLVSKQPYRGINQLLTGLTPYASPWWVTFKQAQALGGSVRKGEKGTLVVFWSVIRKDKGRDAAGNTVEDRFPLIRHYWVFNVAQCDGLESKIPVEPDAPAPVAPDAAAEALWANWAQAPRVIFGASGAAYSPTLDSIQMPPRDTFTGTAEFYATLFHEGVHATGAKDRLNRPGIAQFDRFGSEQYAKEELIAEMGASYLTSLAGLQHPVDNTGAYLRHWIKQLKQDPKLLVTAASAAQKATDYILGIAAPVYKDADDEASSAVAA